MLREIDLRKDFMGTEVVESIYFGGGTPSVLSLNQIEALLQKVHKNFNVHTEAEITLEANPEDISDQTASGLYNLGLNRISLGVQSFNDQILKSLNRAHSGVEAENAIRALQSNGFENITIDLIYGIPGQTLKTWKQNLDKAIEFQVPHLSCYALTIEERTAWGNWLQKGKINPIPDEKYAEEYHEMCALLKQNHFEHYEISNFAISGYESKHNRAYWLRKPYLGIGPGAHSFNYNSRHYNVENNAKYIKALDKDTLALETETLSRVDQYNEYLLTGLRTNQGIELDYIKANYQIDLVEKHREFINQCISEGMAVMKNGKLILKEEYFLIANSIIVEFMVE